MIVRHLAQLTKMQPKGYIKDIKWLGKSLKAYSIKMQYENVFKVIGVFHAVLAFLKVLLLLKLL